MSGSSFSHLCIRTRLYFEFYINIYKYNGKLGDFVINILNLKKFKFLFNFENKKSQYKHTDRLETYNNKKKILHTTIFFLNKVSSKSHPLIEIIVASGLRLKSKSNITMHSDSLFFSSYWCYWNLYFWPIFFEPVHFFLLSICTHNSHVHIFISFLLLLLLQQQKSHCF